jgi:hypothetical protein
MTQKTLEWYADERFLLDQSKCLGFVNLEQIIRTKLVEHKEVLIIKKQEAFSFKVKT